MLLGQLEDEPASMKKAVASYRAALEETPCDRLRSKIKQNLGAALTELGNHEGGTARLKEAVTAYRAALEERSPEQVPLKRALTQSNLGAALLSLGRREQGTTSLEEAVAAYRTALDIAIDYSVKRGLREHERMHVSWGITQSGLAEALAELAMRRGDADRMREALIVMQRALEVYQRSGHYGTAYAKLRIATLQSLLVQLESDRSAPPTAV